MEPQFRSDPARKLSANLYDMYHCCVYSEKLLIIDRRTFRSMQNFIPKINLTNQCIQMLLLQGTLRNIFKGRILLLGARFPLVSLEFFIEIILPALRSIQALTEMSTRNISGGKEDKGGRCVKLTSLPPSCADCLQIWGPQPPGTLKTLLFTFYTMISTRQIPEYTASQDRRQQSSS